MGQVTPAQAMAALLAYDDAMHGKAPTVGNRSLAMLAAIEAALQESANYEKSDTNNGRTQNPERS